MARRISFLALAMALISGCGEPPAGSPAEQALRDLQKGRYEEAIATCDEALRENPKNAIAYQCRGRAYHYRNQPGDLDRAVADFSRSIELAPKDPMNYYSRALALRDQGKTKESAQDDATARELDSQVKEVYAELAEIKPSGTEPAGKPEQTADEAQLERADQQKQREALDEPIPVSTLPKTREPFGAGTGTGAGGADESFVPKSTQQPSSQDKMRELLTVPQYKPSLTTKPSQRDDGELEQPAPQRKPASSAPARNTARGRSQRVGRPASGLDEWEPEGPRNPWSTAGQYGAADGQVPYGGPSYEKPVQSPFRQAPPRPTGFSSDEPQFGGSSQTSGNPNSPYRNPGALGIGSQVQRPGAYQNDYNP